MRIREKRNIVLCFVTTSIATAESGLSRSILQIVYHVFLHDIIFIFLISSTRWNVSFVQRHVLELIPGHFQ